MMILAVYRIFGEVFKCIVHPAHIPLKSKSQSSRISRTSHHRPSGRLFSKHYGIRELFIDSFIEFFQKIDCFFIVVSSLMIWFPLSFFATIVKIKHRSNSINTNPIKVVLRHPKVCTTNQKCTNFIFAIIEDIASPLRMKSFTWIKMFIECSTIKVGKSMHIYSKVRRHPIHNHSNTIFMHYINKCHKILWRTITCGWCKITCDLITP